MPRNFVLNINNLEPQTTIRIQKKPKKNMLRILNALKRYIIHTSFGCVCIDLTIFFPLFSKSQIDKHKDDAQSIIVHLTLLQTM